MLLILATVVFIIHSVREGSAEVIPRNQVQLPFSDLNKIAYQQGEFSASKLTDAEALNLLQRRIKEKLRQSRKSRKLTHEEPEEGHLPRVTEKFLTESCGTSSSLICGENVLQILEKTSEDESVEVKCNIRKDFLNCIDSQRERCRKLGEKGILPLLPPKDEVLLTQDKVWKSLWTSGGCLLN